MANSTTNLVSLTQAQGSKEVTINSLMDSVSQAAFGGRKDTSAGVTWDYYGGNMVDSSGNVVAVANGSLTLATGVNYIQMNQSGTISSATTGFVASSTPLYTSTVAGGVVTAYTDKRANFNQVSSARKTHTASTTPITFTSDYYGLTFIAAPAGTSAYTLPANGAAAGSWFDVLLTTDQTITISAATADTLITFNDLTADSVAFSTAGQKIGAYVRFISNGSFWVAINLSNHTMTVAT